MKTLMESYLTLEQTKLLGAALEAQTRATGTVELPLVARHLGARGCRDVLDVGTGEGSFLLEVARRGPRARFLGIDHNRFAVEAAAARARRRRVRNARFAEAFFDAGFDRARRDAVLTRYTLQHASEPEAFVAAVVRRLARGGTFVAVESVEDYMDCHGADPVWSSYRAAVLAIHARAGSDANVGKALGGLFRRAGLRDVQVTLALCAPSTAGYERFRDVVLATAALGHRMFPDLFDRALVERMGAWLEDRAGIERRDPYIATAVASGRRG